MVESQRGQIQVFTSAAVNYFPKVRLLCNSIKRYHPEFTVHLALADQVPDWLLLDEEPFDSVIRLEELGIPSLRSWIFRHSLIELCTAIKPFVLRYLLQTPECGAVLYFDPDIVLFSRVDDLLQEFSHGSILLTPHQTAPEKTLETIIDNEVCSLRHGIYNLGFIGIKNDRNGQTFVDWWCERLYHFCLADRERGFWVDQKWVDLAPALFEGVRIVRCARFNVAPWNITTRKLAGSWACGFTVEGQPLGFYHFTGFDSGDHEIMASKYGGDNPALKNLIQWYKQSIIADEKVSGMPWAFGTFENGEPIKPVQRVIYRLRKDLQDTYQDPFKVIENGHCYYNWFHWRAAIEHPELLGENGSKADERLLPAGYRGKVNWVKIFRYISAAIRNPRHAAQLCRRTVAIFKREGLAGLKRRLS
ncbi:MAG: glycosyl transferase [Moorellaceae bacterium]